MARTASRGGPEGPEGPRIRPRRTPGLDRRALLGVSTGLVAGALLPTAASGAAVSRSRRRGSFEELTDAWTELYRALRAGELTPDECVYRLEAELARVEPGDVPERARTVHDEGGLRTGPAWGAEGHFLVVLELAPGARIRAHDHPAHTVVTTLKEGACRARHFDRLRKQDAGDERVLRCTKDVLLGVWDSTEVCRTRDNVHEFVAGPEGAVLLDFTMETGEARKFEVLDLEEEPLDAFERTFRARVGEGL